MLANSNFAMHIHKGEFFLYSMASKSVNICPLFFLFVFFYWEINGSLGGEGVIKCIIAATQYVQRQMSECARNRPFFFLYIDVFFFLFTNK